MAAAAQALVEDGARVLLSAPHEATAAAAVARLTQNAPAGAAAWAVADNADPAALGQLITAAKDRFGRLDGALISVGGSPPGPSRLPPTRSGDRRSKASSSAPSGWPGSSPSAWPARTEAAAVPRPPPSPGTGGSIALVLAAGRQATLAILRIPTAGGNGRSEYERRRPAATPAATPFTTVTSRDRDRSLKSEFLHNWWMDHTSITAAGVIDTFLVLLIGIGPKLALVPFVEITSSLDAATKRRVLRQMMVTAATVALILMVLGELLRALLHFTVGSLSIAGGVILFVLAVWMVLGQSGDDHLTLGKTRCSSRSSRWPCPTCSIRWASSDW